MAVHRREGDAPPRPDESIVDGSSRIGWVHYRAPTPKPDLEYITTPPYPARGRESLQTSVFIEGAKLFTATVDRLAVVADITGGLLQQVYFPIDYTYRKDDSDDWEGLTLRADLVGGQIGQTYFPLDYFYRREGAELWEGLTLAADLTGGQIGGTYFPVDYLNWPEEGLSIAADITGGSLT